MSIKQNDKVLVSSRWGKVIRPAYVTDRVIPGVVMLGEGAWVQMDEELGIDLAGATNTLNGQHKTGQGQEPWNSLNVQIEKWTGEPVEADYLWPLRVPIRDETDVVSDELHLEPDKIRPITRS